jgi:hypothetical protein
MLHVKWVLCHQDMACLQVVDGGDSLQMYVCVCVGGGVYSCKYTEQPTTDSLNRL